MTEHTVGLCCLAACVRGPCTPVKQRGLLCCEEEARSDKLVGLALHRVIVAGEARAGRDGAVVCAGRVEAIEGGPDRKNVVHNGVNTQCLSLLHLHKHGRYPGHGRPLAVRTAS